MSALSAAGDWLREALGKAWDDGNATGLDGYVGPGRGAGNVDSEAMQARELLLDKLTKQPKPLGIFPGPHGEHLIDLSDPSVTVVFDGTAYRWTANGPEIRDERARAVILTLLRVALTQVEET